MPDLLALNEADIPEYFERRILELLMSAEGDWFTVEELARSVGDVIAALDAMSVLFDARLIHRQDEYVVATRAAIKAHELLGTTR